MEQFFDIDILPPHAVYTYLSISIPLLNYLDMMAVKVCT